MVYYSRDHRCAPEAPEPELTLLLLCRALTIAAVPGNGVDNSDVILSLSKAVAASVGKPEQVCGVPNEPGLPHLATCLLTPLATFVTRSG